MTTTGYMPVAKTTEWETPPALFDALDKEFGPFTCDPACQPGQYTTGAILSRGGKVCFPPNTPNTPMEALRHLPDHRGHVTIDGLGQDWRGIVYLNPPYGKGVDKWIEKAVREVTNGNCQRVVALVKATTDVRWWQKHVLRDVSMQGNFTALCGAGNYVREVRFLPGRLKFGGQTAPAPFPSAVIVWELEHAIAPLRSKEYEDTLRRYEGAK